MQDMKKNGKSGSGFVDECRDGFVDQCRDGFVDQCRDGFVDQCRDGFVDGDNIWNKEKQRDEILKELEYIQQEVNQLSNIQGDIQFCIDNDGIQLALFDNQVSKQKENIEEVNKNLKEANESYGLFSRFINCLL